MTPFVCLLLSLLCCKSPKSVVKLLKPQLYLATKKQDFIYYRWYLFISTEILIIVSFTSLIILQKLGGLKSRKFFIHKSKRNVYNLLSTQMLNKTLYKQSVFILLLTIIIIHSYRFVIFQRVSYHQSLYFLILYNLIQVMKELEVQIELIRMSRVKFDIKSAFQNVCVIRTSHTEVPVCD